MEYNCYVSIEAGGLSEEAFPFDGLESKDDDGGQAEVVCSNFDPFDSVAACFLQIADGLLHSVELV